jgi:hypothetical protein
LTVIPASISGRISLTVIPASVSGRISLTGTTLFGMMLWMVVWLPDSGRISLTVLPASVSGRISLTGTTLLGMMLWMVVWLPDISNRSSGTKEPSPEHHRNITDGILRKFSFL